MRNGILLLALSWVLTVETFEPARFESGTLFIQPPMTAGGGEVLLELEVAESGEVSEIKLLRTTPPFGDLLREAVRNWRFAPAREVAEESEAPVAVESKVLVAGLFRPPTLYDAPARGEPPANVASPSAEVPFPTTMVAAPYPPTAYLHMSQAVVIEVEVGTKGEVASPKLIQGAEGLNAAALEAAGKWRFRPAQRKGKAVPSVAYIVFGFREPVVSD